MVPFAHNQYFERPRRGRGLGCGPCAQHRGRRGDPGELRRPARVRRGCCSARHTAGQPSAPTARADQVNATSTLLESDQLKYSRTRSGSPSRIAAFDGTTSSPACTRAAVSNRKPCSSAPGASSRPRLRRDRAVDCLGSLHVVGLAGMRRWGWRDNRGGDDGVSWCSVGCETGSRTENIHHRAALQSDLAQIDAHMKAHVAFLKKHYASGHSCVRDEDPRGCGISWRSEENRQGD